MRRSLIVTALGLGLLSLGGLSTDASAKSAQTAVPRGAAAITPVHDMRGWRPHQHVRPHIVSPPVRWTPPRANWHRPSPPPHARGYQRNGWQRFGWR